MNRVYAFLIALVIVLVPISAFAAPWPHTSGHYATVWVEDHAGKAWHVFEGAHEWSSGFRYGPCDTHSKCVQVWAIDQGKTGYTGSTYTCKVPGKCKEQVIMNSYYLHRISKARRAASTLHELGHVLGLGHDYGSGVMYPVCDGCGGRHNHVSSYERYELRKLYGVK